MGPEEAVRGSMRGLTMGAICPVKSGEQRIAPMGPLEPLANLRRRYAHRLVHDMAGGAGTPVGAETLEEGAFGIVAAGIDRLQNAARIDRERRFGVIRAGSGRKKSCKQQRGDASQG